MEMVMKFPNGETRNLLIEVFNYRRVCASQIRYTSELANADMDMSLRLWVLWRKEVEYCRRVSNSNCLAAFLMCVYVLT